MSQTQSSVIDQFLDQLVRGGDFADIPMTPNLSFTGPLSQADTADQYRHICSELAEQVVGISINTRASERDTTHLTYDVDLGLPEGSVPTAHIITFNNNAISNVEVIFDAMLITGAKR